MPEPNLHETSILRDALIFLLAAVVIVPIFQTLRVRPIVGYLIAGASIGPFGLTLVQDVEGTHRLAEFGVVFMLFMIGLELSLERLRLMARHVFLLGASQVAATGLALGSLAVLLGASLAEAAVIGGALALSSTAFVLQILHERGELATQLGRIILAILLFQDLAVIPGLAVVTALGNESSHLPLSLTLAALKAILALFILLVAGRFLLRPIYRVIAGTRSPELFAATTLLIVLGTAWSMAQLGLSMALGGFLAGLTLAGTEYRHQVEADIRPFRGILLALFFISVGMLIDLRLVGSQLLQILALVLGIVAIKAAVLVILGRAFGLPLPLAVNAGLHLAEGGEFAFVIFSLAMAAAVLPLEIGQILLASVAVSMALSPMLASLARSTQFFIERRGLPTANAMTASAETGSSHVIIAGFGRVGRTIGRMLDARGQAWIAIDADPSNVLAARADDLPVFFGDAGQDTVLLAAGANRARAAVITMDEPKAAATAVALLRARLPDLPILVRARDAQHMNALLSAGASKVIPELTEASLLIGGTVLQAVGTSAEQTEQILAQFRGDSYAKLDDLDEAPDGPASRP
jgi:CPA2 family monovalent cation:H+ antiporter-2